MKGYAIHDRIRKKQIEELRLLVRMVGRTMSQQQLPDSIESQYNRRFKSSPNLEKNKKAL